MQRLVRLAVAASVAAGFGFAAQALTTAPRHHDVGQVTASARFVPWSYSLSVDDGLVALSGGPGNRCTTTLLDPVSLSEVRSDDSCRQATEDPYDELHGAGRVAVTFKAAGDEIRVLAQDPRTHREHLGPVVMTLQNWDWNHSVVAEDEGTLWIYGLDAFGLGHDELAEVSSTTGQVVKRFRVDAGADPYLFVDADGLWLTSGFWAGEFCASSCELFHVARGSNHLVAVRQLGIGTQWLVASGHSIWADVLTSPRGAAMHQTIWRLDGAGAKQAFKQPARLLPGDDFGPGGYVVEGNAQLGWYTISELGSGTTAPGIGACDSTAPVRVVRIDPSTGEQSYVAALPLSLVGRGLCSLAPGNGVVYDDSLYLLAQPSGAGENQFARVIRVSL